MKIEGEDQDVDDGKYWVVGRTREQATKVVASGKKFDLEPDEGVLDTWFSSWLWPYSIVGWPEKVCIIFFLD